MLVQLFDDGYYGMHVERTIGVILLVRSGVPFPDISSLKRSFDRIDEALLPFDRGRLALVFDVRKGQLRNDPVFESVSTERRRRVQTGFARRCVLVGSTIGKIQIERHASTDPFRVEVFDDPKVLEQALGARGRLKL